MYETYRLSALCLAAHVAGADRGFGEGGMSFRVTVTATNGYHWKDPRHIHCRFMPVLVLVRAGIPVCNRGCIRMSRYGVTVQNGVFSTHSHLKRNSMLAATLDQEQSARNMSYRTQEHLSEPAERWSDSKLPMHARTAAVCDEYDANDVM
ncbi:hypothetical protein GGI35DRAFT_474700 [Trichoderma velutinum]